MWNSLTTLTNITAYYPVITALSLNDKITAYCVMFAAGSSAISHLFESHKHNMWGFGCPPHVSYVLNRLDVMGVVILVLRVSYLWSKIPGYIKLRIFTDDIPRVMLLLLSVLCNLLSERDKGFMYYLPLHCVWHMSIFLLLNSFLKSIYSAS
jgi:hypothetical protein